jgi:hypothetical protein
MANVGKGAASGASIGSAISPGLGTLIGGIGGAAISAIGSFFGNKSNRKASAEAFERESNNPFVVNGRPVYNKWLPTMKGGADKTPYKLHQCNWERDFLTTAVPNPQQGANAPLVGLTVGDIVTRSEDGTYSVEKKTVLVDEDGSKYGVSYRVSEDGERLVGVDYDPVSEKTPITAINSYAELASLATTEGSGFTIETLRYVNAYQKYLGLRAKIVVQVAEVL